MAETLLVSVLRLPRERSRDGTPRADAITENVRVVLRKESSDEMSKVGNSARHAPNRVVHILVRIINVSSMIETMSKFDRLETGEIGFRSPVSETALCTGVANLALRHDSLA